MFDNLYLGADIPRGAGKDVNAILLKRGSQIWIVSFYVQNKSTCRIAEGTGGVRTGSQIMLYMGNM